MSESSSSARLAAIAAVDDPARRALFDFIARSDHAVGRDEAAAAAGLARTTAAFHLDRLEDAGLLSSEFARLSGRSGPGAGRPSKLYRSATSEVSVSIPQRHYDLMGDILASAIEVADASGEAVRSSLTAAAHERGVRLGDEVGSFAGVLDVAGYEPEDADDGTVTLTNCPFHRLAASHTAVICQANVALLEGAAEGAGDCQHDIRFDPSVGHCCVRLTPVDAQPLGE